MLSEHSLECAGYTSETSIRSFTVAMQWVLWYVTCLPQSAIPQSVLPLSTLWHLVSMTVPSHLPHYERLLATMMSQSNGFYLQVV
jgi:hypothetical protein